MNPELMLGCVSTYSICFTVIFHVLHFTTNYLVRMLRVCEELLDFMLKVLSVLDSRCLEGSVETYL